MITVITQDMCTNRTTDALSSCKDPFCKGYYLSGWKNKACSRLMHIQSLVGQPLVGSTCPGSFWMLIDNIAQLSPFGIIISLPFHLPIDFLENCKCMSRG